MIKFIKHLVNVENAFVIACGYKILNNNVEFVAPRKRHSDGIEQMVSFVDSEAKGDGKRHRGHLARLVIFIAFDLREGLFIDVRALVAINIRDAFFIDISEQSFGKSAIKISEHIVKIPCRRGTGTR